MEGDVYYLREALQVLVEGLKDAEVSAQIGDQHRERKQERITHRFMAKLLACVPRRSLPGVVTLIPTTYKQLSWEDVQAQADRVTAQLREHFAQVAEMLEDAIPDILAFTACPVTHW